MATYSNYALRVPASLMEDLRTAADSDGVSMNGCIVQAVAEKIAALWATVRCGR
jgi:predicted HicB family RNase H-like nuclease